MRSDLTWALPILVVMQTDDVSFAVLGLDLLSRRCRVLGPDTDAFAGLIANPNDAHIEVLPVAFASRLLHRVILCDCIVRGQGNRLTRWIESSCRNPRFSEDLAITSGFGPA